MASRIGIRAKLFARLAAPLLLAASLSACSSVPDWVDPTTWIGGDSQPSADQQAADQSAPDQSNASNPSQTPDIATIPPKPEAPSTADEQKQVAESLEADRTQAHYSADALRGGTEAAAPPPAASPPADQSAASAAEPPASSDQASAAAPPPPPDASTAAMPGTPDQASSTASTEGAASDTNASSTPAAAQPLTSGTEVASTGAAAAPVAAPATAAAAAAETPPGSANMQATFAPSHAPALDPSVAQFVPQPILLHYKETATAASEPGAASNAPEGEAATAVKHRHRKKKTSDASRPMHMAAADIAAEFVASDAATDTNSAATLQPASYEPAEANVENPAVNARVGSVFFPRDTTILDSAAQSRIEAAADAFAARRSLGYVRVVGHASSRGAGIPLARRMLSNFERSQARATAVARELIRDGVPAERVLVEAIGDSQARDSGTASQAGDSNRLAEIFLQS